MNKAPLYPEHIPEELKQRDQWLTWKDEVPDRVIQKRRSGNGEKSGDSVEKR